MRILTIKDIGRVISGATPKTDVKEYWDGDISWVTPKEISQLDSPYLINTERKITEAGFKSCSTTLLPKGSILFTSRAPIGLVAIADISVSTNQGFKSIILNEGFYPLYIYYILKYNSRQLNDLGTGTTFKELSKATFEKFHIPVPELPEQIRIATVLTKAESLIKQRKVSVALLDDILKSTFLKMFFQYFPKGKSQKLETLCNKITDGTHDTPERLKKGIKFITGKHIRPYVIDFENSDYVTEEVHKEIYRRCNPEFGDILYTNIGVNLGTAAMNNVSYEFSMKNVALLKLNHSLVTSRYLEHVLNLPSRRNRILEMNSSGGAQQFLSLGQIKNIDIPVPPIDLQKSFSEIVEKSEILKTHFKKSLIELENLYGSLNQKAFKGELDLSRVFVEFGDTSSPEFSWTEFYDRFFQVAVENTSKILGNNDDTKRLVHDSLLKLYDRFQNQPFAELEPYILAVVTNAAFSLKNKKSDLESLMDEKYLARNFSHSLFKEIGDPFKVDEETAKKQGEWFYNEWKKLRTPKEKSNIIWGNVSIQQISNWLKEKYSGHHFSSEMLLRFLQEELLTTPYYFSSEELKKFPKYNSLDDLHVLIFSALNGENPFLNLKQIFYNGTAKEFSLNLTEEDIELTSERNDEQMTGIYFTIE